MGGGGDWATAFSHPCNQHEFTGHPPGHGCSRPRGSRKGEAHQAFGLTDMAFHWGDRREDKAGGKGWGGRAGAGTQSGGLCAPGSVASVAVCTPVWPREAASPAPQGSQPLGDDRPLVQCLERSKRFPSAQGAWGSWLTRRYFRLIRVQQCPDQEEGATASTKALGQRDA